MLIETFTGLRDLKTTITSIFASEPKVEEFVITIVDDVSQETKMNAFVRQYQIMIGNLMLFFDKEYRYHAFIGRPDNVSRPHQWGIVPIKDLQIDVLVEEREVEGATEFVYHVGYVDL